MLVCRPSRDDLAAVHDHVPHVGGAGREHDRLERVLADRVPASRTPSSATVTRSARAPGFDPPGVGPAEARVPVRRGRAQQLGGAVAAALAARQALVELDRARLLEQVDHGVRVAAERQRRARVRRAGASRPMPSARSRSVVGHTQQHGAGAAEQRHVGVVEVRGVHRGEVRGRARRPRRAAPVGVRP